ncbi:MAG: T9SS type A sorting domain-containing protein [Fibrobacteres bacterium]|nr:T9SS type A sorting domain-containing protein [Fibrobacterota bacterium]
MKRVLLILMVIMAFTAHAQLDTSTLLDNQWVKIMDEQLTINQGNWVYENDFKSDPNSSLFILGPGHVIHPQDCYYYPYDIFANKWYKNHSPARPTRQCLSSFAINEQDSMILQMAGAEMSHQLSQGGFESDYRSITMTKPRGSILWAYSLSRNHWSFLGGPTTLSPSAYSIYPQYDPVHDVMLSTRGNQISVYSYHTNKSRSYTSPTSTQGFFYSSAVDTRRGLYYILNSSGMFRFNIDSARGSRVADAGPGHPSGASDGNGLGLTLMAYDEANDVMIYVYDGPTSSSLSTAAETWVFKCDSLVWHKLTPSASPPDRGQLAYNKNLNLFMMLGGDANGGVISRGGGTKTSWAYRYKKSHTLKSSLAPAPVVTISSSASAATLSWSAVQNASGYNIYRASCQNGFPQNFVKLNSSPVSATGYTDNTLSTGVDYSYRVAAVSNGVDGLLSRHCYTVPGIITDLAASVEDSSVVRVSWVPRKDADIAGYNVYRAKGSAMVGGALSGYYTKLNSAPVNGSEYWDTLLSPTDNLKDGVCRGYVVTAVNTRGAESGTSPYATTFPNTPEWAYTVPTTGKFRMGWQPPRRTKVLGVNMYRVQGSKINTALLTDTVTYNWAWPPTTDTDAYSIQGQTYIIRAVNMLGQEGYASDQISPSISTFGFGIVTPASAKFNYGTFTGVAAENQRIQMIDIDDSLNITPNPFNPAAKVNFTLKKNQHVSLAVYNLAGKKLFSHKGAFSSGKNSININMHSAPSGMYVFRLEADGVIRSAKAMFMK